MKTSESIVKIAPALLKAQKNIGAATKGSANPFFKSKYADLGSVMEACKEALNDQGISVLQPVNSTETGHYVETTLLHESGEYMTTTMRLELSKVDMQSLGASISYSRRYGLQSMVFIPAEDNDAEGAMNRKPAQQAPKLVAAPLQPMTGTTTLGPTNVVGTVPATSSVDEVPKARTTFRKPPQTVATTPVETTKTNLNF